LPSVKFCSDTSDFFFIKNFHTFAILNVDFGQIQYFFKVLKSDFETQHFQYHVGTLNVAVAGMLCQHLYVFSIACTYQHLPCTFDKAFPRSMTKPYDRYVQPVSRMRPSLGFCSGITILHTGNLSLF